MILQFLFLKKRTQQTKNLNLNLKPKMTHRKKILEKLRVQKKLILKINHQINQKLQIDLRINFQEQNN
jgi:hypothetical protein